MVDFSDILGLGDQSSTTSRSLPAWADQALRENVTLARQIYNENLDYPLFPGPKVQPFTPDQLTAMNMARRNAGLQGEPAVGQNLLANAANFVGQSGRTWADAGGQPYQAQGYNPATVGQPLQVQGTGYQGHTFDPSQLSINQTPTVQGTQYDAATFDPQNLNIGPLQKVLNERFTQPGVAESYMNPYVDTVMQDVTRELARDMQRRQLANQKRAAARGAFGGARDAILRAETQRNYERNLADTLHRMQSDAYRQARGQFNQDIGRGLEAQQFNVGTNLERLSRNQQTGLQGLLANQGALNTARQFGAEQGMRAQLANQDTGMRALLSNQQTGLQGLLANQDALNRAREFSAGQSLDAQLANQQRNLQAGLANQQAQNTASQFNIGQGMDAYQMNRGFFNTDQNRMMQAGGGLANLAGQAQDMASQDMRTIMGIGDMTQQFGQQNINQARQDFRNQFQWPYQNFQFLQAATSGTPFNMFSTTTETTPGPNPLSQIIGLGADVAGLGKEFGWWGQQ